MNEDAARARRVSDEAQQRHDGVLQQLEKLSRETHTTNLTHAKLVEDIRQRWAKYIKVGAEEIAVAQARATSEATLAVIERRLQGVTGGLDQLMGRVAAVAGRAEAVSESLQWKTLGQAGLIAASLLAVLMPLSVWWGGRSMASAAEDLARAQSAGYARLQELSKAEFRGCEVAGVRRLCVRIEPGSGAPMGPAGAAYAVVHGY